MQYKDGYSALVVSHLCHKYPSQERTRHVASDAGIYACMQQTKKAVTEVETLSTIVAHSGSRDEDAEVRTAFVAAWRGSRHTKLVVSVLVFGWMGCSVGVAASVGV